MRRSVAVLLLLLIPTPATSLAWNAKGHRAITSIAYRQLDEPTRRKLADILKRHPAYPEWKTLDEGVPETLALLWNASVFPDEARREPWTKYGRPRAHYVNFRVMAEEGNRILPPVPGENVINSYVAHLRRIGEPKTSAEDRALHLSWISTRPATSTSRSTPSPASPGPCRTGTGAGTRCTSRTRGRGAGASGTCTPTGTTCWASTRAPRRWSNSPRS